MGRRRLTHGDSLTFRLDPALKAALAKTALAEHRPVGDIVRDLVQTSFESRRREEFAATAKRQSQQAAAEAADPNSDEAKVMRWIADVTESEDWNA
ncbi:MAG: hypothetical protein WBW61_07405 [Rhodanobacteraceae bacterium]